MCFFYILERKTHFSAIKTRSSKSREIDIFPKGLTHGFARKFVIFPTYFFLDNIGHKNVFHDILELENAFLGNENSQLKKSKNGHFSKGVKPWFCSKTGHFFMFFFRQYRPRICVLWYSRTKKRFSRQ